MPSATDRVFRFDAPMDSLGKPRKMRGGGLRVDSKFTKPGVFPYDEHGRTILEYRPSSEVFAPASVESWKGVPITDGHPSDLVTSDSWREHAIGLLGDNVRELEGTLATTETIHDRASVGMVVDGKRPERSGGYWAKLDSLPGVTLGDPHVPDGIRYDRVQREIEGNHVAILPRGDARLGRDMAMRLDAAGHQIISQPERVFRTDNTEKTTMKLDFGGKTYDLEAEADRKALARDMDAHEKAAQTRADSAAAIVKERDEIKGRLDAAEKKLAEMPAAIVAGVAARIALETEARAVLGADARFDGKTDDEVRKARRDGMVATIVADDPESKCDGLTDEYIAGRFAGVKGHTDAVVRSLGGLRMAAHDVQSTAPIDIGAAFRAGQETARQSAAVISQTRSE